MKNILISEFYKLIKSFSALIIIVFPIIICLLVFIDQIDYSIKDFIIDKDVTKERNNLFLFYSQFFTIYFFLLNIFIVTSVLVYFFINKGSRIILYTYVSYQNLFNILVVKLFFFLISFLVIQLFVFIFSLLICKGILSLKPDFDVPMDIASLLLIFLSFYKINFASLGAVAFSWILALLTRNFIIIVPSVFLIGSILDIDSLPFNNSINSFVLLYKNRKLVFSENESSSIYNSLSPNFNDLYSFLWICIVILIIWIMSKKFPAYLFKVNS
ncbi:MAG: hypothetical protein ACK4LB_04365 [Spirosomataceae bacterium]